MNHSQSAPSTFLERASKWTVLASAVAAIACGVWLGARAWAPLLPLSVAAFIGAFAVGKWQGTRVWAPALVCSYIFPAVLLLTHGEMDQAYWNIWMAGVLGGIAATTNLKEWSFPERWKWPLAYWALAVALVWPAVVAREADFSWALMSEYHIGNSFFGGSPPVVSVWVLQVTLIHLLSLLWFDAAFASFPVSSPTTSLARFTRDVAWPLVTGLLFGSLVAIYQGAVDITWLSGHQYVIYRRATASLDDGNAFGAVAGFWIGGLLALAASAERTSLRVLAVIGAGIAGAGLWATGSSSALIAAGIVGVLALWYVVTRRRVPVRDVLFIGVPAIALIAAFAFFAARNSTANPLVRFVDRLPGLSKTEVEDWAAFQLWNRYGPFGTVSMKMARDYPLSGIGVGSFNHIFPDESFALIGDRSHQDNAQSWYRHQLAELGFLGSLGWIVWLTLFAGMLLRSRGSDEHQFSALMIKGALVAIGLVSLVSMPTQSLPVAFTVMVFAFWYLLLSPSAVAIATAPGLAVRKGICAAAIWMLALVMVGATLWSGWRSLRPPFRAIKADWTYQLGIHPVEQADKDGQLRWTERHATEVLPVSGPWLKLTVGGGPADIATRPIRVEIKRSGRWIIGVTRQDLSEQTWYVRAPEGAKRMMLEFEVSRTWRASDFGGKDTREVGMFIRDWTFVQAPPRGAVLIQ